MNEIISTQVRLPKEIHLYIKQEAERLGVAQNAFLLVLRAAYFLHSNGKENEVELVITDELWIPKTLNDLCVDLPFWSIGQIRRITGSCKKQNLILTENYNQDSRDRRLWYAVKGLNVNDQR